MNDHVSHFSLVSLGFLLGMIFSSVLILFLATYIYKKTEGDGWKFKLQKPLTTLISDSFVWDGDHHAFKDFDDSFGNSRRCLFKVRYHYEAECNEENISRILAFEKEYKVTNSEESDRVVGRAVWSIIKKRIMDKAGSDFFEDEEVFGELAIEEQVNPFNQLAPELKVSKNELVSVVYSIAKIV